MEGERGAFVRSGMVLSCVKPGSGEPSNKWMQQTRSAPWPVGGAALAADPCVLRTLRRRVTPTTEADGRMFTTDADGRMPTTDADCGCLRRTSTTDAADGRLRRKPRTGADDGRRRRMPTTDADNGCSRRMLTTDAGHERQATMRSTPQNKWMQQTRSAPWASRRRGPRS